MVSHKHPRHINCSLFLWMQKNMPLKLQVFCFSIFRVHAVTQSTLMQRCEMRCSKVNAASCESLRGSLTLHIEPTLMPMSVYINMSRTPWIHFKSTIPSQHQATGSKIWSSTSRAWKKKQKSHLRRCFVFHMFSDTFFPLNQRGMWDRAPSASVSNYSCAMCATNVWRVLVTRNTLWGNDLFDIDFIFIEERPLHALAVHVRVHVVDARKDLCMLAIS